MKNRSNNNLTGILTGFILAILMFVFVSAINKDDNSANNSYKYEGGLTTTGTYNNPSVWMLDKETGVFKIFPTNRTVKKVIHINFEKETRRTTIMNKE